MKYILAVLLVTGSCTGEKATVGQVGQFDSLLACEHARQQFEVVARETGAREVGTFCAGTKDASFKMKGGQ